jgi:exocyst complex component 2
MKQNVRMLLTLSNLQSIRNDVVPQLILQFETDFSVKLTDESKTIKDVLSQIDARLFQTYTRPIMDNLTSIVSAGIMDPTWLASTGRPTNARPYIYDMLLAMVIVHTEVSTTSSSLTSQILKYLLEQTSGKMIELFKNRSSQYSLAALMQATVDVEFMAQTLGSYTTDKASDHQSRIYLVLDERTDKEARARLQKELPELRATLKRLREGTKGEL